MSSNYVYEYHTQFPRYTENAVILQAAAVANCTQFGCFVIRMSISPI